MASAYPFATTWTGAGDGMSWSDPANWTNGVPLTGADAPTAAQDLATIDNSVEKTPFTLTIAGQQTAGEIDIDLIDPAGGVAVSLTGTLNQFTNTTANGSGFGVLKLNGGTFEIDGGTLGGGEVSQNGGTLAFGAHAQWGDAILSGAIIDGTTAIDNASTVVIQKYNYAIFDGNGGYGTPATVTISDGSTLSASGSLYLDGLVDVKATGTLSLDGGDLSGWGGTGTLFADGGAIDVTQSFSVDADFTIEGGLTFTNPATISVRAGGELTLESSAMAAPMVVDLDGGTIDVTGALNLQNTVLENGTLILEAGSTYTIDATSSVADVTVTDNRPAGQTNWTGAAGDGDWSNAANWNNGVPQSGLGFATDGQSIAVINNIIDPTPSTIVISGPVNAQDIYVNATDPSGGPSVSLTGTLDTSYSGEGLAYGYLDLLAGTFEIDGGSLNYTGVGLNGGTLAFGPTASGSETFHTDILNGNWGLNGSDLFLTGYNIFHGQGGGGMTTVTLDGGSQLLEVDGTLALDGTIDIKDGGDGTLFALDGGNLSGYGGDAATIFLDGGTFAIDANTTFSNAIAIYGSGGVMVFGNSSGGFTVTIDASSVTTIGQAGGAQTTVNLNGGTLDVFGTLDLTNTNIENGTIRVESGGVFNQDATDTLNNNVTILGEMSTATNWTGAGDGTSWTDPDNWDNGVPVAGGPYLSLGQNVTFIDNAHGDTNPFTVVISGDQVGALVIVNAADPMGGAAVRLEGSLNLATDATANGATLGVLDLNAGTFEVDGGTLDVLNVNQNNTTYGGHITFGSASQYGAATLNASGIAGSFTIGNGAELVIAQNSFGAFNESDGVTVQDVSIEDNSTLDIRGSLGTGNNIDIYSGTVILDGGSLSMGNGAKIISEGGGLTVTGNGTFDTVTYDGAVTIGSGNTLTIASGDTATLNNLGNQYTINLGGGTVDVQGTLDVEGSIINPGNLTLENGSQLVDATVNAAVQSDDPTVTVHGSATLDNVSIDAPITMVSGNGADVVRADVAVGGSSGNDVLTIDGVTTFGNAADPSPMQVELNGGVIDVVGTLNLINTHIADGTIIIESGATLNSDATSSLDGVTIERTLANGDLVISGENVALNALQTVTTAQNIDLDTGVTAGGAATGTPGEATFLYGAGFAGAGVVTVTDANGLSKTDFNGASLDANVAGATLTYKTDTWLPDYGSFTAENGATLVVGDAAHAGANLTDGVFDGSISATGASTATFYAADGIATVNGSITLDNTSTIQAVTPGGTVALAQSLTSIGSQNPATGFDQSGILNLDDGASFIDPNAVTLYGNVNLTGGTFSTGGLSGNEVVYNSGFGYLYASGVTGYGTLDGPFGSTAGNIFMEASGGTLTYNGTVAGFDNFIADANSTLIVNSALDTAGYTNGYDVFLKDGSTVDLTGALGDLTNLYINFAGSNATLKLNDPVGETFGNINVSGQPTNGVIDLAGLVAATSSGGTPDVTITRTSGGSVVITIAPLGNPSALDTFTITNAANTKVTFNPSDGSGGSEILLTADPVITGPGAVSITQGFANAISGISVADAGIAADGTVTATLTDATGLLNATGAGVTGGGTTTLVVTGSVNDVNTALATLTDTDSVLGTDVITVSAVDGAGNSATTQTVNAYVQAPIVIVTPSVQYVSQDTATAFGYAEVYEQGALNGADLTVTVSDVSGVLTATGTAVSGSGTNALTISGSQTVVNAALAALTIKEVNTGNDTVTVTAQDAAGDKAQSTTIAIMPVAPPTSSAPTTEAVTQNSITTLSGFSVSDPSSPYGGISVTLSDNSGLLSANGSSATGLGATSITLSGSVTQVNAELATLTIDEPNSGTDTLTMAVSDSFGGTSSQSVSVTSTHVAAPDLTVSAIAAPSAAIEGQTVQLTWTVTNSGDATATGPWTDNVYLASDAAGTSKTLVGSFTYTGTLTPGQSETETQSITVPTGFSLGAQTGNATTYFVVQADAGNQTGALSGIQNHVTVASAPTGTTATVDWTQIFAAAMPVGIDAADYALIEQRFVSEVGTTAASLETAINAAITALDKTSGTAATASNALNLLVAKAYGALGDQTLAQVAAPSTNSTGLNALLTPGYNSDLSSRNSSGVFGDGWTSEFNDVGALGPMNGLGAANASPANPSYVVEYITTYVDQYGDYLGQSISYQVVAPARYGVSFLDSSNPYSNYTQTNANGTIETFSGTSGLLVGISDGQGNAITINRNASGVITSIVTASGHPPTFTVNALGNITSATDSSGNTVTYAYDASGAHLLGTTSAAGTTSYQYSASGNAFVQNALTQVTNPDGSTQSYTYSAQGDLASQSVNGAVATTYSYSGANTITQTNGDGQSTVLTYDASGQLIAITDAGGNAVTVQRDANGNAEAITTATGQTYHYTYDSSGNLTSLTDPLGHTVQETYTAGTSNVASVTDQNGNATQYTYNTAGQLSGIAQANGSAAQYLYNAAGQVSEKIEASGATVKYSYDAAGQVSNEAFSDGTSQSYTYNASGNLTSSTAVDGGVTVYAYNAQGLLASVTNPAGQVESYSYNAAGQETQRVEPDGSTTNYAYTAAGQLAQITDSSGAVIATYTYDAAGVLVSKATGNGASTVYGHDAAGNLTEIKTLASDGSTTSKIDYTYDADDRIATAASGAGTWTYTYDGANQITHAVFASTDAAIASQNLTYVYDAAGNRTQTIFNGATTNYTTNNLNQYTSVDGTTYAYDANGNLLTKVSGGSTTTYTYNVQNQLISSTDASGTTTYTYDALGNIASQTVGGVKTSYVSDPLAINTTATGPLSAVAQAYNASGQATATYTYGNGLTAVTSGGATSYYNADASGNITSLSGANGALTETYAYTPSGTLLNSTGSVVNPFQFNGQVGAITQSNGLVNTRSRYYDPTTGRFTSEDPTGQAGGINVYTYAGNNPVNYIDANGDSISLTGVLSGIGGLALTVALLPEEVGLGGLTLLGYGIYTGARGIYNSLHQDGNYDLTLHNDTTGDIVNGLVGNTLTIYAGVLKGPVQVVSNVLSQFNSGLSLITNSDVLSVAYDFYFGPKTVNTTDTVNVPAGGGWGDVHLTTFDGLHYNFQAVGEFLLVKSTAVGDNFQVQIRLSALGGGETAPTLTTEIGIQVGNDRVTFDAGRSATVWVNGVASGISASANTLTLAGGTISQLSQNTYQLTEKTGEVVNITDQGSYLDYTVELAPSVKAGTVEGLLGTYTGSANAFQLPDGTALGSSLTAVQLYQTFGDAWRITDPTSLLDYGTGETTATYTDLAHPTYGLPVTSLPTAVVQAATDAAAAAGLTGTAASDAVFDYLETGDPTFITNAPTTGAAAPVTATATIAPSAPPPPSIGISPSAPSVTEVSGHTPVTFTVSLTSAASADTVVEYTVSSATLDAGKTYFGATDFGGTLPSGAVTILAGQTQAQFTLEVPDSALGTTPDKWLAVGISTPGADPIYAATAQVDILNKSPVAGIAAQPVLEYVPGNTLGVSQIAPALTKPGSSYILNLGNVVQGTSLAALQFALANMASAPADALVSMITGAAGSGFGSSGLQSATQINAGHAVTAVTLQPLTSSLGAQSETVTFGALDVNSTGYTGALANITLTVTDNVLAAAQAVLGTNAITLADARVGSVDAQTITVTNTAATGAAALDVTLDAANGAAATGSIAQLAAGASDSTSLSLGLATTTAGLQSSFVTLNLASDLGNGVETPLSLNQSVSVTGSVYRAATATVTQPVAIVHVGDTGSQDLSIANSDLADGYSEGLRATVTGATGDISASGTTGLIAAGTTDASSIAVRYSTATSGVVSGQVDLGLTSDGTGVDSLAPISIGTDQASFSVQVDNYATADLKKTSGGGTLTGSAKSGYMLDLGTIMQGTGPATIDLAALNSASGLADLLSGSFGVTGDLASLGAFTNSGLDAFSGLSAGQSDGALSVSLSTANNGTFSETITLTAAGSNASGYSGAVAPVTLTIHGQVDSETPVVSGGAVVTGAITELSGVTGSASVDTAQGSIAFTDTNLPATHAASVLSVAATGVTSGAPGNAALLSLLSLGTLAEDTASVPGSVAWNFAAADATFDYLAAGETLTLTYAIKIAEISGGSVTQNVTVTVTGTNDVPVITSGTTSSAALTAIVASASTPANDTAGGTIRFSDADLSDTHTATIASVTASGNVAGLPSNAALLALLATTAVTEQAGAVSGSVGWNFTAPDAAFAYLAPGQSVTLTYAVDVSDNHGATAVQDVTVTVTGAGSVIHSAKSGAILGTAYASADTTYTAQGVLYSQTFYDASGNVVASESFSPDGSHTITIGGHVAQIVTVTGPGSFTIQTFVPGTFQGLAYASHTNTYPNASFVSLQTFYDASGNVVGTESYLPDGSHTITVGGKTTQIVTVTGPGSFTIQTFVPGTFQGLAVASRTNTYPNASFVSLQTFYDASGNVVGTESYSPDGSHTITVGGKTTQIVKVTGPGSFTIQTFVPGTFQGLAVASRTNTYPNASFVSLQTFYDASGNVVGTESYSPDGSHTITVGGKTTQIVTVTGPGSFTIQTFVPGTFQGLAVASRTNTYPNASFVSLQTFYDASGNVVGTESYSPDGSHTITVGGKTTQIVTVTGPGSFTIQTFVPGTFQGLAVASRTNTYPNASFVSLQTFYDASGNVVGTESYSPDGSHTITVGGKPTQIVTVTGPGSFTIQVFNSGTFHGVAFASRTNRYPNASFVDLQTYYDASGNVVGTESHLANGSYTDTVGGLVVQANTVNTDGSTLFAMSHITGQPYTARDVATSRTGVIDGVGETLIDGSTNTALKTSGLTLTDVAGVSTIFDGADTFSLMANTHGILNITGAANTTLAYGTGDGAQIITGFATSGAGADALSFSHTVFADYAHLMGATTQQGSDLLITLDASDSLLLKNVTMSNFTTANAHFT